jgi:hypothetical protein
MHTYDTSVHIECKHIYDDPGVRDVNLTLVVQGSGVGSAYIFIFFGLKYKHDDSRFMVI